MQVATDVDIAFINEVMARTTDHVGRSRTDTVETAAML